MVGRFDFKVGAVNWTKLEPKQAATSEKTENQRIQEEGSEYFSLVLSSITHLHILIDCDLPSRMRIYPFYLTVMLHSHIPADVCRPRTAILN